MLIHLAQQNRKGNKMDRKFNIAVQVVIIFMLLIGFVIASNTGPRWVTSGLLMSACYSVGQLVYTLLIKQDT